MENSNLNNILEQLRSLGPIFHHPELGTSKTDYERMTATDFWEVGASGTRYEREEVINECLRRYPDNNYQTSDFHKNDIWQTKDFAIRQIAQDCYLLTYILLQGREKRPTQRMTIWRLVNKQWQIFYHQGTLIQG